MIDEHRAMYYRKAGDGEEEFLQCLLCPQGCAFSSDGDTGFCGVRKRKGGELLALNYGRVGALAMDPVEKKPLYHFMPGKKLLSAGAVGCNLRCSFCQNWQLARGHRVRERRMRVEQLVEIIRREPDCVGMAYTYSEPLMWYEYLHELAPEVRRRGYSNVLVTNGYIRTEPLRELLPAIDAANIDLKAFRDDVYREHCGGTLEPVLNTIRIAAQSVHVEVTTLLIPGVNDGREDLERLTDWLARLDPDIPLHLTRYFPHHRMRREPTPLEVLEQARALAKTKLNYVYLGNLGGGSTTLCPECGNELIVRKAMSAVENRIREDSTCPRCNTTIPVVLPG